MPYGPGSTIARLVRAVGIPLGAAALVITARLLVADGPDVLAETPPGQLLIALIGFAGFGLVVFSQLFYTNVIVFFGAFFALCAGLATLGSAVTDDVLLSRGTVTTCTVLAVHPVSVTSSDGDGDRHTRIDYVNDLACPEREVTAVTTSGRVAEPGEWIEVVHDPYRRLDPRPVGDVDDPGRQWLYAWVLLAAGAGLRLLCEYGVRPFRSHW